jgi:hypothetical protein
MTMYQPNDDVRPTGAEIAEFDDAPPAPDDVDAASERAEEGPDTEPQAGDR